MELLKRLGKYYILAYLIEAVILIVIVKRPT